MKDKDKQTQTGLQRKTWIVAIAGTAIATISATANRVTEAYPRHEVTAIAVALILLITVVWCATIEYTKGGQE